jgi:hypothetical protein
VLKNHTGSDGMYVARATTQISAAANSATPMISLTRRETVDLFAFTVRSP